MANVYFGDTQSPLKYITTSTYYNASMTAVTASGGLQTFNGSNSFPSITNFYPIYYVRITFLANSQQRIAQIKSTTSGSIVLPDPGSVPNGSICTVQLFAVDWNNPSNWFSVLGYSVAGCFCCSTSYPGIPLTTSAISCTGSGDGTSVTLTHVANNCSQSVGDTIAVVGFTGGFTSWNGTKTVTASTSTTVTFTNTTSGTGTGSSTVVLRRCPIASTDNVIFYWGTAYALFQSYTVGARIVTPPTLYSGSLSWAGVFSSATNPVIIAGNNYTGTINISIGTISYSILDTGVYPGTINLSSSGVISRGTFTGTVIRPATAGIPAGAITGGTYSPSATIALGSGHTLNSGYPNDPGFLVGGGTFSPNVLITGVSDILGAGLP